MKSPTSVAELRTTPRASPVISSRPLLSSPDVLAREIIRGLYVGRFVQGQKLVEGDLSRDFGISRGTVREALRRLAAEGVVSLTLHRGAYIRALSEAQVEDVLMVFEVLVGLAAREAAKKCSEGADSARLTENLEALLRLKSDNDFFELVRTQTRFYRTIAALSENEELGRILPSMNVHFVYIPFWLAPSGIRAERFDEYRDITAAILRGDANKAEALAREHVRNIIAALRKLPSTAFASVRGRRR